jgi:hypothetical protein
MSLDFVAEVWDALRSHIDFNDRTDAADSLVNLLIDNNYEAEDIKDAFKGDKEMLTALKENLAHQDTEESYEDYDEDDQDEEWD